MEEVYFLLMSPVSGIIIFLVAAIGFSVMYANEVRKHTR